MQSLQEEMVHSICLHDDLDRFQHDVEYVGTYSATLSTCIWMGKMDSALTVIFGSDRAYFRCFSFYMANGLER